MSIDQSVNKSNVAITIGSYLSGFLAQGMFFLLLARALGPSSFGLYSGALAISLMVATISGVGSGNVLVSIVSRDRTAFAAQNGTSFVYISISALVLIPTSYLCIERFAPGIGEIVLPILVAEIFFGRIFDLGLQVYQAFDRLSGTALFNVLAGVLRLLAISIFMFIGSTDVAVWGYWYLAVSSALAVVVSLSYMKHFGYPRIDRTTLRRTWRLGIFFSLGMSSRTAYVDGDKFVLGALGLAADAGFFAAGARLLNMAFTPVQAVVYSSNTQMFRLGSDSYRSLWGLVRKLLLMIVSYSAVGSFLVVVLAPVVPVLLGPAYFESSTALVYLTPILLLQGIHYLFGDALMAAGRQGVRSIAQLAIASLSLAANFVVAPYYGWKGAAIVSICSSFLLAFTLIVVFTLSLRGESEIMTSSTRVGGTAS